MGLDTTPLNKTILQKEVTATTGGSPYRWAKRQCVGVVVEFYRPKRARTGDKVKLDYLAALAGAKQGDTPEVAAFAHKIDSSWAELLWKILHHDRA